MAIKNKPNYATATNLDIRPVIDSDDSFNYYFRKKTFAQRKIALIKEKYIVRDSEENKENKDQVTLWIRKFDVTPEERAAGYKGNFACIYIQEIEQKSEDVAFGVERVEVFYGLAIKKVQEPARFHPDRRPIKQRHPNWGTPILRQIKGQPDYEYNSFSAARAELERLNEDYPDVSILANNILYIMVYQRDNELDIITGRSPIQKIILKVRELAESRYVIDWEPNPVQEKLNREKVNVVSFSFQG